MALADYRPAPLLLLRAVHASSPSSHRTLPAGPGSAAHAPSPAHPGAAPSSARVGLHATWMYSIAAPPSSSANLRRSAAPVPSDRRSDSAAAASSQCAAQGSSLDVHPDPASLHLAVVPVVVHPEVVAPNPAAQTPRLPPTPHHTASGLLHETSCSLQNSSYPVPALSASRRLDSQRVSLPVQTHFSAKGSGQSSSFFR